MASRPASRAERGQAALAIEVLTWRERCVLSVIADHDGTGKSWPAAETIAARLPPLTRSGVFEVLNELERKGALTRRRSQRSNRYTVHYPNPTVREIQTVDSTGNPDGGTTIPPSGKSGRWDGFHRLGNPDGNKGIGAGNVNGNGAGTERCADATCPGRDACDDCAQP